MTHHGWASNANSTMAACVVEPLAIMLLTVKHSLPLTIPRCQRTGAVTTADHRPYITRNMMMIMLKTAELCEQCTSIQNGMSYNR